MAKPGCDLWSRARATRILTNPAGKVVGVEVFREGRYDCVVADVVVVAAGAIETARLLLCSATPHEPNGIGNQLDWVGRNLQGHYYPGAFAVFDDLVSDLVGPGPTIAITQFNHGNPGLVGGGMLADDFISLPAGFVRDAPPHIPRFGPELKEWVRRNYLRCFHISAQLKTFQILSVV
jgi:choline dehydrogenase-like flavoprotein